MASTCKTKGTVGRSNTCNTTAKTGMYAGSSNASDVKNAKLSSVHECSDKGYYDTEIDWSNATIKAKCTDNQPWNWSKRFTVESAKSLGYTGEDEDVRKKAAKADCESKGFFDIHDNIEGKDLVNSDYNYGGFWDYSYRCKVNPQYQFNYTDGPSTCLNGTLIETKNCVIPTNWDKNHIHADSGPGAASHYCAANKPSGWNGPYTDKVDANGNTMVYITKWNSEHASCNKVDCEGKWGVCDASSRQRTFNVTTQPKNGGKACPVSPEACTPDIDCVWGSWNKCDTSRNKQFREKTVLKSGNGLECTGKSEQFCTECRLSTTEWGACDSDGKQKQKIMVEAVGEGVAACAPTTRNCPVDCVWSTTEWDVCGSDGKQKRKVTKEAINGGSCNPPTQDCTAPVDCVMSEWTKCDPKSKSKTRTIITPKEGSGKACGATSLACVPDIDCVLSAWGDCDSTTKKQKRTVVTEASGLGKECESLEQDCEPTSYLIYIMIVIFILIFCSSSVAAGLFAIN